MGRKRKIEKNLNDKKPKKSKTDESNVRRKIITHFQDFLYQKLKRKVKKISYKVYTRESINYLKNVFKMKISTFFKQEVNEKGKNKSNDKNSISKFKFKISYYKLSYFKKKIIIPKKIIRKLIMK